MAYEFRCESCRAEIRVKWLKQGEQALCRACGHRMEVPAETREIDDSLLEAGAEREPDAPVKAPAAAACRSCRWLGKPGAFSLDAAGTCRRYPPAPQGGWPGVSAEDWCGEFASKP